MSKTIRVGIAEMKITRLEGRLITYALGSCVGICLYDPIIQLGGMVHVMLPKAPEANIDNILKYADTGVLELLRKMEAFGAVRHRIVAKIAGGSKMFDIPGDEVLGGIGKRNVESVKRVLAQCTIRIAGEDLGGRYARTMEFDVQTGQAMVRSYGRETKIM